MRLWFSRHKKGLYKVSRAMRDGRHAFSVLAWDEGFEFLLPSGVASYSSVHNGHVERILEGHAGEIQRRATSGRPFNSDDYLRLGSIDGGGWGMTKPVSYLTREQAIETEVAVLDEEMKNHPDSNWIVGKVRLLPADYSDEPLEKELGLEDLAEAIIERVHFSQYHDSNYLDLRIQLLCTWIGLEFDWQSPDGNRKLSALEELIRGGEQLNSAVLPIEARSISGYHRNSAQSLAYFAVIDNMESEYASAQSLLLQIHRTYVSEFLMSLTTPEDRESTFTLEELVLDGLPRSEDRTNQKVW
jgi:hypothetical protein